MGIRLLQVGRRRDPILVGERSGENARVIVTGRTGEHNHFPTWSIDGKWIYYVHYADEAISADLWRIPSIGGVPERLTEEYGMFALPHRSTLGPCSTSHVTNTDWGRGCGRLTWRPRPELA